MPSVKTNSIRQLLLSAKKSSGPACMKDSRGTLTFITKWNTTILLDETKLKIFIKWMKLMTYMCNLKKVPTI